MCDTDSSQDVGGVYESSLHVEVTWFGLWIII